MNDKYVKNILTYKGDVGKKWLDQIPTLIKTYEQLWSITVGSPFQLSYNYVAKATRVDGQPVVLKIGVPDTSTFWAELEALRIYNGNGSSKLLAFDTKDKVMLLEKLEPGFPLSLLDDDDKATHILATVLKKLWYPVTVDHLFPTLEERFEGFTRLRKTFNGQTGPLPEKIVSDGESLYKHLLETSTEPYLLHGDFHHDNVLSATREPYLAIDPHGVVGERAFDTATMLRNPKHFFKNNPDPKKILSRRIAILSEELGIDKERIKQWGIAQNVLSAIWTLEDHGVDGDWKTSISIADALSTLQV